MARGSGYTRYNLAKQSADQKATPWQERAAGSG